MSKYLFGIKNLRWGIKEIITIYSGGQSFFSKKRIESGIAFIAFQVGMWWYFVEHYTEMDIYALLLWAGAQLGIAGYQLTKIEKEKELDKKVPPTEKVTE